MRILEHKPRLHQRIVPIQSHAIQKQHALGIDKYLHISKLKDVIPRPGFRSKLELIAKPGTASAQNAKTQAARYTLASEGLAYFLRCLGGNVDLLGRLRGPRFGRRRA